jgi:hypothetical protein
MTYRGPYGYVLLPDHGRSRSRTFPERAKRRSGPPRHDSAVLAPFEGIRAIAGAVNADVRRVLNLTEAPMRKRLALALLALAVAGRLRVSCRVQTRGESHMRLVIVTALLYILGSQEFALGDPLTVPVDPRGTYVLWTLDPIAT